ncbi:MAG: NADAR family protein, partial [Butyricicoccus sp.]
MMSVICFHNPDEENGYLSNWYLSDFVVNGVKFSSMEQFMMYRKAVCFHDEAVAEKILSTNDVAKIKLLVRQVS